MLALTPCSFDSKNSTLNSKPYLYTITDCQQNSLYCRFKTRSSALRGFSVTLCTGQSTYYDFALESASVILQKVLNPAFLFRFKHF